MFYRAAVLLPFVRISLRIRGFQKTRDALQQGVVARADSERNAEKRVQETARMVRAAARNGLGSPSCLEESLVLCRLLSEEGIASQLRVGVKRDPKKFEAHAWVECNGVALNETEALHDYVAAFDKELSSFPPTTR